MCDKRGQHFEFEILQTGPFSYSLSVSINSSPGNLAASGEQSMLGAQALITVNTAQK